MRDLPVRAPLRDAQRTAGLRRFLTDRLTEDLARVWERSQTRADPLRHPGMAAQVEVVDDLLDLLASGELPELRELRILLFGYGAHAEFDPTWNDLLGGRTRERRP